MSGSNLTIALNITGNAKAAVAALEETRRAQLQAFAAGRDAADKAATQWKVAEAEVKRLAGASREAGAGHDAHAKATAEAAAKATEAKAAWVAETQALMQRRAELVANAAALDRARQAESLAAAEAERRTAASKMSAARDNLGVTPFRDIDREIAKVQASYNRLAASGKLSAAELAQAQLKVIERTKDLQAAKNGLLGTFERVRSGAVALAAQFYVLALAMRQAREMETAMAEVSKVADFKTPEELKRFKLLLEDLTQVLPYTAKELAAMAAAGAQMGIPTDQLGEFVTLAGSMGIAFRMSAEDVGNAIAKIMNVFHLTQTQVEDLGDTINYLGNNTNATERDILNVMTRVGGMANIFGVSARQTAALATAFLSLGRTPEVAATAINALLQKLATVESADKSAQEAFKRTGLSIVEFSALLKTEPQKAIETFLKALEKLPKSVKIDVLSGFVGREYADDIALLAEGVDKYREALILAHAEEARGGVGREAAKQAGTTDAAFKRLKEQMLNLGDAIASPLLPLLTNLANGLSIAAGGARDFVEATGPLVSVVAVFTGLTLGLGTLRVALGASAWAAGSMAARFGVGTGVAGALTTATAAASKFAPHLARLNLGLLALGSGYSLGEITAKNFYDSFAGGYQLDAESDRLKRAVEIHKDFNTQIERLNAAGLEQAAEKLRALKQAVLSNDQADVGRTLASATEWASKLITLNEELAAKKQQLSELTAQRQAIIAGREVLTEQQTIEARIAAVKRLADQKRRDMDEAVRDMERYRAAAEAAYARAADIRMSTADRVRELRRRDMSEEAQQADIAAQAQEKLALAAQKAAAARQMAGSGDTSGAEKAAAAAEALAKQAESLGGSLKNTGQAIGIVEQAGKVAEAAAKAVGAANAKALDDTKSRFADFKSALESLSTELDNLERRQRIVKIDADIAAAQTNINAIQAAINSLQDKTVTVTVVQRAVEAHSVGGIVGGEMPRFATGGALPGYGGGDRIHALLEAGEFVMRKEAVRRYGLDAMMAINSMRAPLPAFAVGGIVMAPSSAGGGASSGGRDIVDLRLSLPGEDRPISLSGPRDDVGRLARALNSLARAV